MDRSECQQRVVRGRDRSPLLSSRANVGLRARRRGAAVGVHEVFVRFLVATTAGERPVGLRDEPGAAEARAEDALAFGETTVTGG